MRLALILSLLAAPVAAWQFSAQPICRLDHAGETSVAITYDGSLYAITLTRPEGWPRGSLFTMAFQPIGPVISTRRHRIVGNALTVTDRGFGNVLNGVEFNAVAIATVGETSVTIDLSEAAPEVQAFRACSPGVST